MATQLPPIPQQGGLQSALSSSSGALPSPFSLCAWQTAARNQPTLVLAIGGGSIPLLWPVLMHVMVAPYSAFLIRVVGAGGTLRRGDRPGLAGTVGGARSPRKTGRLRTVDVLADNSAILEPSTYAAPLPAPIYRSPVPSRSPPSFFVLCPPAGRLLDKTHPPPSPSIDHGAHRGSALVWSCW